MKSVQKDERMIKGRAGIERVSEILIVMLEKKKFQDNLIVQVCRQVKNKDQKWEGPDNLNF